MAKHQNHDGADRTKQTSSSKQWQHFHVTKDIYYAESANFQVCEEKDPFLREEKDLFLKEKDLFLKEKDALNGKGLPSNEKGIEGSQASRKPSRKPPGRLEPRTLSIIRKPPHTHGETFVSV